MWMENDWNSFPLQINKYSEKQIKVPEWKNAKNEGEGEREMNSLSVIFISDGPIMTTPWMSLKTKS